jgi:type II secretory pathway pseudopilin PulG
LSRKWLKRPRFARGGSGLGLLETVVALGVLGFIGVAFMTALSSSFKGTDITKEQVMAENLARTQLEYIRDQSYCIPPGAPYFIPPGSCGTYEVPPTGVTLPPRYSIIVGVHEYCDGQGPEPGGCYDVQEIQNVTAAVFHDGELVTKIDDLKTNR